jgi:hypothetical protein
MTASNTQPIGYTETFRKGALIALTIGFCLVTALPVLLLDNLPLVDYPEHLAMFHIIANLNASDHLSAYYEIHDGVFPYWGIQAMMSVLVPLMGVEPAIRLFSALAILSPLLGTLALSYAWHARLNILPFAAFLLAYNGIFFWGFLNFLFCSGIAMAMFAGWIASAAAPQLWRYLGLSIAATLLIWMHPLAAALLGMMVGLWEVAKLKDDLSVQPARRTLGHLFCIGLCFAPAVVSLAFLTSFDASPKLFHVGTIVHRLIALLSPFWMGISNANGVFGLTFCAVVFILLYEKKLHIIQVVPLFLILLTAVAMLVPMVALNVAYLNYRLPLFICLLFVASLAAATENDRATMYGTACLAILFALKTGLSIAALQTGSSEVSELRESLHTVPKGAKVLSVMYRESDKYPGSYDERRYQNLSSYLVIDRDAFVSDMFASVGVVYQPEVEEWAESLSRPGQYSALLGEASDNSQIKKVGMPIPTNWRSWYDHILVVHFGDVPPTPDGVSISHTGSYYSLLKIQK